VGRQVYDRIQMGVNLIQNLGMDGGLGASVVRGAGCID